jgi:hypothetical protein
LELFIQYFRFALVITLQEPHFVFQLQSIPDPCSKENLNNCPNKGNSPYQTMSDIKINCKGVTKLLKKQNMHKATGPHSIPSLILKSAADQLAPILTEILMLFHGWLL